MKKLFYSYPLGDSFDFQWNEDTRTCDLTDEIKKKFKLLDNSKTKIYIPHQDEPIFDFGEWKVSGKYLEDILGNTSEVTVIVKYTMMSKVSDTIAKPHKVKISSDVQNLSQTWQDSRSLLPSRYRG